MSDRSFTVALLLAALASPIAGQDVRVVEGLSRSETLAAIETTVERIRRIEVAQAAEAERVIERTIDAARRRFVSVGVGPYVLVGDERLMNVVQGGVEDAWDEYRGTLGADFALERPRVGVMYQGDLAMASLIEAAGADFVATGRHNHRLSSWRSAGLARAREAIRADLAGPVSTWSRGFGWTDGGEIRWVLRDLLRDPHPLMEACFSRQDLGACADGLFLDYDGTAPEERRRALQRPDDGPEPRRWSARVSEWIDTDAGRGWLQRNMPPHMQRICRPQSALEQCAAELASAEALFSAVPATGLVRGSLLNHAIRTGGDGAYRRLENAPEGTTIGRRLELASGLPLEDLVSGWLTELDARTAREGLPRGSLMWAGLFVLLSLTSTRWRLG